MNWQNVGLGGFLEGINAKVLRHVGGRFLIKIVDASEGIATGNSIFLVATT